MTPITDSDILRIVANEFGILVSDITDGSALRTHAQARGVAMYILHKRSTSTFAHAAKCVGNKYHSTAIKVIQKVKQRMETDEFWRDHIKNIERQLEHGSVDRGPSISREWLFDTMCNRLNVSKAELCGASRKQDIYTKRVWVVGALRELCQLSYPEIAEMFGRDYHNAAYRQYVEFMLQPLIVRNYWLEYLRVAWERREEEHPFKGAYSRVVASEVAA